MIDKKCQEAVDEQMVQVNQKFIRVLKHFDQNITKLSAKIKENNRNCTSKIDKIIKKTQKDA